MESNSENIFKKELPNVYIEFLRKNPNGDEIEFNEYKDEAPDDEGRYWNIMGENELLEEWEMIGVGKSANFECLKLYVKTQKEFGAGQFTSSNVGKVDLNRVESGFVIGDENGDYLYIDSSDNFSVWVYYHDGGDVRKIAASFGEFINN
ncbi:hypothetical protein WH52_10390 [Tenacibaculum holothuriorum]|uniref:Knr4/Smi1-like domain-containing protein n=1 Tax=Tenacibaculum holothuriorum TaxID=1635173 RepID=A0A1Y2PBH6_9FLAO|nr:SMI1/KNR4 family protein [Tenacibaculum holothuriorum]OSY87823.1 hypothetical protein WH52_10390 [Tenacibaculum holothuriorum]